MLRRLDSLHDARRSLLLGSSTTRRDAIAGAAKLALSGALGLTVAGQLADRAVAQATPTALNLSAYPEVKITLTDKAVQLSTDTVSAGLVLLTVTNQMTAAGMAEAGSGGAFVVGPPAGMSFAEFQAQANATPAASSGGMPAIAYRATILGGPGNLDPGQTGQAIINLPAGQWAVKSYGPAPLVPLTATPGAYSTSSAPKAAVTITEVDFSFSGFTNVPAGPQIWQVEHHGTQPHMLVLVQLPAGTTMAQIMQLLSLPNNATPSPGGLNPNQILDRGGVALQSKGTTVWPVVDLSAGHYGAVCFVPDPTKGGEPHAMEGMVSLFDVK